MKLITSGNRRSLENVAVLKKFTNILTSVPHSQTVRQIHGMSNANPSAFGESLTAVFSKASQRSITDSLVRH